MLLNWINSIEERTKALLDATIKNRIQSRIEAQKDLVRINALNENVKAILKENNAKELGTPDSAPRLSPSNLSALELEAQLAKLKGDMSEGYYRGPESGSGPYIPPPFGSGPYDPSRVPRRPLPTVGAGEIALPLPDPEDSPDT